MLSISNKADNTPGTSGELSAAEFNDHKNEIQAAVTRTGQTLTAIKTPDQLSRSMFINGVAAQSFQNNSATANSIELTPITGSSGLCVADSYPLLNGAIVEFSKTTANTSATVTVNIGQTTGTYLGAKSLKKLDGTDTAIGELFGYFRIRWDNTSDYWVIISSARDTSLSTAADYTGTDTDGYKYIDIAHSATTGLITYTLPTVADNKNRVIRISNMGNGLTYIDGESAETISYKGTSLAKWILYLEDDYIEVRSNGSEWKIERAYSHIESGWYNRSDYTSVNLGFANFDYDTKSTNTDWTGQKYTLASGVTGIIIADSAPSGASGTFTVYKVTGTGLALNNESVTAGDGRTALVNEAGGTSNNKDQNWAITHNMGVPISDNDITMKIFSSATEVGAYIIPFFIYTSGGTTYGSSVVQTDLNSVSISTTEYGVVTYTAPATPLVIDSEDWFTNIKLEFSV